MRSLRRKPEHEAESVSIKTVGIVKSQYISMFKNQQQQHIKETAVAVSQ